MLLAWLIAALLTSNSPFPHAVYHLLPKASKATLSHPKCLLDHPLAVYRPCIVYFKLHLYFPGGGGGWVVIIKLKANLSSNWTGLGLDWN